MPLGSTSWTIRTMRPEEKERPKRGKARRVSTRQHWGDGIQDGLQTGELDEEVSSPISSPFSSKLLTNKVELSSSSPNWFSHSSWEVLIGFILSCYKTISILIKLCFKKNTFSKPPTWSISESLLRWPRWQPLWNRRSPYNPGPTIGHSKGSAKYN